MPTILSSIATENNDIYKKDRPENLAGLYISDVLAVVAAERRELPRSREAGGARRRQVVEDHAGNVGRVRSERK